MQEVLRQFHRTASGLKSSGALYCHQLKDIQETLQSREVIDSCRRFGRINGSADVSLPATAVDDPLEGHTITAEFRTKMTDWMIEVCSSFKCQPRTYFLAVTMLDKYLMAARRNG